jgi:hypothetical protein
MRFRYLFTEFLQRVKRTHESGDARVKLAPAARRLPGYERLCFENSTHGREGALMSAQRIGVARVGLRSRLSRQPRTLGKYSMERIADSPTVSSAASLWPGKLQTVYGRLITHPREGSLARIAETAHRDSMPNTSSCAPHVCGPIANSAGVVPFCQWPIMRRARVGWARACAGSGLLNETSRLRLNQTQGFGNRAP